MYVCYESLIVAFQIHELFIPARDAPDRGRKRRKPAPAHRFTPVRAAVVPFDSPGNICYISRKESRFRTQETNVSAPQQRAAERRMTVC